jgi:glycosyltransferase involved in cell wall biosynthesis
MLRSAELQALRAAGRISRRHDRVPSDGALRVLAHVPGYPPASNAGSEQSMRAILTWLAGRGHPTTVLTTARGHPGMAEGVQVVADRSRREAMRRYADADVVLTQLEARNRAARLAAFAGLPLVQFLRMGGLQPASAAGRPDLVVYNAEWMREQHPWPGDTTVLHAPVFAERYRTTPGDAITLVNLNELKGGPVLAAMASALPRHRFLGVLGDYGEQIVPDPLPANVEIVPTTPDIRTVLTRTRILLMPSRFETFGRLSLEAAASGIPTIAAPVAGLREALGDAGIWAPRDDPDAWADQIRRLDDPAAYAEASRRARERSEFWDPEHELLAFEARLQDLRERATRS